MKKRSVGIYIVLLLMLSFACRSIVKASKNVEYIEAAGQQSLYKLTVTSSRGIIYDYKMNPLVNRQEKTIAAVTPSVETLANFNGLFPNDRNLFAEALNTGTPFLYPWSQKEVPEGLNVFHITERYEQNQLAPHIVGYLDGMGNGVTGLELAMNDTLMRNYGEIAVYYHMDALGRVIPGAEKEITDTTRRTQAGVVTTLDIQLQRKAQELAKKLGRGSVIVAEVPNCEIRAVASAPDFSPLSLEKVTDSQDAPLINRAFSSYSPGSVFKLLVAADALENGMSGFTYTCEGFTEIGGMAFHCFNQIEHGVMTLQTAIENSCNAYFIQLGSRLGGSSLLTMASNLGFGKEISFGKGLTADAGNLPTVDELLNKRALANFSFGQGSLMVTPLQIAGLVNTIAAGGEYTQPKLLAGTVDDSLNYINSYVEKFGQEDRVRVFSKQTAEKLQQAMELVVESGTGTYGRPEKSKAGAKTGTAQTGNYEEDKEKNHYWFAGYVYQENKPRYVIVAMRESITADNHTTAGVFKEMAEYIDSLSHS